MRIAYLYSRYPVVSQTFCDSEMLALEAMGFELEIVSLNRPPDSFRHERLDRLKAEIHYPPPGVVLDAKAKAPEFAAQLGPLIAEHDAKYGRSFKAATRARNAWHFAPLLKKLGVQHVHVHFANRATHSALFLKKLGFSFSFTAHAQDFMVDLGSDDLLREMVREAEFVVGVSDFSRELLARTCPDDAAKILRIFNGIELDDFPAARPEQGGALRIVSIGRLIEFKGFQDLIGAVGLLKKRGLAVNARIIGEGPWRGELESLMATEQLAENVTLLGVRSQEQIKHELAEAHLFALPSIMDRKGASDILPTVITEAMACKLPVVSTRLAGIPEMVADGVTGLLVEPGNAAALADAIEKLSREPEMRKQLGEAGRQRAEKLFSLAVTAGQLAVRFKAMQKAGRECAERHKAPVVYLMNEWGGGTTHVETPGEVRVMSCSLAGEFSAADEMALAQVELLPDAAVIESHWLRSQAMRQKLERLRDTLGDAVGGGEFYLQARRAVYLANVLPRRGVQHVHAFRSDAVVCAWLLGKLTDLRTSAAIEEQPAVGRTLLAKLLADFDMVSVSDEKLCSIAGNVWKDALMLQKPPTHHELRIGPFRLKKRATAMAENREGIERGWFEQIKRALNA